MEIETVISGNKNELNIMMVMPLVIVTTTKGFINNGEFSVTNFVVKICCTYNVCACLPGWCKNNGSKGVKICYQMNII